MKFDFYSQYKNWSTSDLLVIVRKPSDYQPEAVTAAQAVLSERVITEADQQASNSILQAETDRLNKQAATLQAYKNKAADFLQPIIDPQERTDPGKWLNILLLVIAIQYIWIISNTIKELRYLYNEGAIQTGVYGFIICLPLLYTPLIFFLLWHRKRWGWILLYADNLIVLALKSASVLLLLISARGYMDGGDLLAEFLMISLRLALFFYLTKETVMALFRVDTKTKKDTNMVAGTIAVVFIILSFYMAL